MRPVGRPAVRAGFWSALIFVFVASNAPSFAQDRERIVPMDKIYLGNRLSTPVKVVLLPDVGTYEVAAAGIEEFACKVVKGFALSDQGPKIRADCGKRYTVTRTPKGLEIIELTQNDDRH